MVSPQNDPNVNVGSPTMAPTGRGFVTEESRMASSPSLSLVRNPVSWGSVIGGSLLALALLIHCVALGYALGIDAFAGGSYGFGAGLWSIITSAICFFVGGWLAAYLSGHTEYRHQVLHGILAWALCLTIATTLFALAGSFGFFGVRPGIINAADAGRTVIGESFLPGRGLAWGVVLSQLVGLIFAALGGGSVAAVERRGSRYISGTTTTTSSERPL